MFKQCLQAELKQNSKQGHKHVHVRTDVLTKNYSPEIHVLTFVNARRGAAKNEP